MKIGVVGSGMIVSYILKDWEQFENIEATAIWCREQDKENASLIANEHDISNVYTSYEDFLNDDSFDFVYIGLVNSLHYEYSKKALLAKKSVICEKPFTSSVAQARELVDIAKEKGIFIFESCLPWYSDNYEEIKKLLPEIGNIRLVECSFSQYSRRYESYQNGIVLPVFDPKLDGGALYDLGVYSIHFIMGLFQSPTNVQYFPNLGFNGIDTSGVLVMDYGNFKAICTTAKDCDAPSRCVIEGDKGYIFMDSQPSSIEKITLRLNGQSPMRKDVVENEEGFRSVYKKIEKIVEANDFDTSYAMIDNVVNVMQVMETARKSAGIQFSCD